MKKIVSIILILVLFFVMNAVNVNAANQTSTDVASADTNNPKENILIESPIDAVKVLEEQINELPMTAFYKKENADHIKNDLKTVLKEDIRKLEDGKYAIVVKDFKKNIKSDIQKHIVQKQQESLIESIDTILETIENAIKTTVTTSSGKVAGFMMQPDCQAWMGIPYAEAPVGKLRWKAPVDHKSWKGIHFATSDFPCGVQIETTQYWEPSEKYIGSEDCLYLNIFRPKTDENNLPVYFWIHGGGNTGGSAQLYNASNLAKKSNMIVVVIQYRLGVMGWMTHPALNPTGSMEDKSGNYGSLDIIKALKWVRKNINAFGGNPQNITIAGESAGGANVLNLMISPLAKGLFQKAVAESPATTNIPKEAGVEKTNIYIDQLLVADKTCTDLAAAAAHRASMSYEQIEDYLRNKSAQEIQSIAVSYGLGNPFIDGNVIPGTFSAVFESGNYNKVPIIIGSNEDEMKPFLPYLYGSITTSSGKNWSLIYNVLGMREKVMTLEELMPSDSNDREFYETVAKYPSMGWKANLVDSLARSMKKHQDQVYCYYFKWKGKGAKIPFDFIIGAGHGFEIPFFFGWDNDIWNTASYTEENKKGRVELQNSIMSYIASFAASDTPNLQNSSLPYWEQWSNMPEEAKSIIFDADLDKSRISMMNEEFKMEDIRKEIEKLPLLQKNMIMEMIEIVCKN